MRRKEIIDDISSSRSNNNNRLVNVVVLSDLRAEVRDLEVRIDELTSQLAAIRNIKVIKPVMVSEKPVNPKRALIVVLTFILSLLAMTIMAITLHYVKSGSRISENQG